MSVTYGYGHTKNKPPCYQCMNREVGCHSNCEKYMEWKNELRDKKRWLNEQINPVGCRYFKEKTTGTYVGKNSKKRYK